MHCVTCNAWVITEEEAAAEASKAAAGTAAAAPSNSSGAPSATSGPPGPPAASNAASVTPAPSAVQHIPLPEDIASKLPPATTNHDAVAVPRHVPMVCSGRVDGSQEEEVALSAGLLTSLSEALVEKLWQAQQLLVKTPASESEAVRGAVGVVSDCLSALAKIRLEARR